MNVEYAMREGVYKRRTKQAHVPGEADEMNVVGFESADDFEVVGVACSLPAFDDEGFDAACLRVRQTLRVGLVAYH